MPQQDYGRLPKARRGLVTSNIVATTAVRTAAFLFLFILLAQPAPAQCTKKLVDLPAAPELLGFRLGMTREQVKARVPQIKFGGTDDFGVSKTTVNPHFDASIDKSKFEGVRSVSLDLLDDKLTSLWIGFDETFQVHTIDDFIKLISQSLQVDGNWSSWKSRGQQLRCADFQLVVTSVAGGPSFRMIDLAGDDLIAARRQAKEERDSAAEDAADANEAPETLETVGDKQTKTYYPPNCQPPKEIAALNKALFKTPAEAEKAGFKIAKNCH